MTKSLLWLSSLLMILFGMAYASLPQIKLYQRYQPLINALEQAQQHPYGTQYQCVEFSKDLVQKLKDLGADARIEIVQVEGEPNYHAVVSLQIEPQTGQLVNHQTIDTCRLVGDDLVCDQGTMTAGDMYVASSK